LLSNLLHFVFKKKIGELPVKNKLITEAQLLAQRVRDVGRWSRYAGNGGLPAVSGTAHVAGVDG
jgi:hypothetical protein